MTYDITADTLHIDLTRKDAIINSLRNRLCFSKSDAEKNPQEKEMKNKNESDNREYMTHGEERVVSDSPEPAVNDTSESLSLLNFEPFSVSALIKALPYIRNSRCQCSDISAGSLFMWQKDTDLRFCEWNNTFVIRQDIGDQPAFTYPEGADPEGMTDKLMQYTEINHLPLRFFAADDIILEKILDDARLKNPMHSYDIRWSDYIYSFEEAKTFKGRKFRGQRNHINKFRKLYGEPDIRFLTPEDIPAVENMLDEYSAEHSDAGLLEILELEQTRNLLPVYESLGLYAAGLFVDEKIAAFTIGEIIGDMLLIHVEKGLRRYEGAYPVMYSGFVNLMDTVPGHSLKIINREDDSGDTGIRTSKMQYQPVKMIHKHLVHIDAPAKRMAEFPVLRAGSTYLTAFRETDKQDYLKLNTDSENNLYWGYDYREDAGLTGSIDENTFYDSAMLDMQAGDSINFAIRLSEEGGMAGESILWNFTADGRAEIGCRLMPEYQNRGYGKAAFGAAADFAEKELKLKVYARCFRENKPSEKMITACGFEPWYETETHLYFRRKSSFENN